MVRPLDRACYRRIPELMRRRGAGRFGSGGLSRVQLAERLLAGTAPKYEFRAESVVLDGSGNIASVPNRQGADSLVLAAGTIAGPQPDLIFGGAQSLVFGGAARLDWNLALASQRFMHNGAGLEVWTVAAMTSATNTTWSVMGTSTTGTNIGFGLSAYPNATLGNGASRIVDAAPGANQVQVNVAHALGFYYKENAPLEYALERANSVTNAGATSLTPSALDPTVTLRLGALGAQFGQFRWVGTWMWDRVLSEWERQLLREFFAVKYGVAAPVLAGDDRYILSLVPFADLSARYYATAASKVAALLDRARPGHSLLQATGAQQTADPTPDAALSNELSCAFLGAQYYDSSLPLAAWKFMHSNYTAYDVFVPTDVANGSILHATISSGFAPGHQMQVGGGGQVFSGAYDANNLGSAGVPAGTVINGNGYASKTGINTTAMSTRVGGVLATATASGPPSASNPAFTFCLGTRGNRAVPYKGRWARTVVFDRQVTAAEDANINAALLARYGKSS